MSFHVSLQCVSCELKFFTGLKVLSRSSGGPIGGRLLPSSVVLSLWPPLVLLQGFLWDIHHPWGMVICGESLFCMVNF